MSAEMAAQHMLATLKAFLVNKPHLAPMIMDGSGLPAVSDDDDTNHTTDDSGTVSFEVLAAKADELIQAKAGAQKGLLHNQAGAAVLASSVLAIPGNVHTQHLRYYRIASSHKEVVAIVRRAMAQHSNWREVPPEFGNVPVWNMMWSWGSPPINRNLLLSWQKVNHFKHARELTRKDLLKKNLARYQVLGAKMQSAFALQPPTYVLPKEYMQFAEMYGRLNSAKQLANAAAAAANGGVPVGAAAGGETDALTRLMMAMGVPSAASLVAGGPGSSSGPGSTDPNIWIMKPVGLSRGRGISLVSDIGQVQFAENTIIQKYVHNPLLLDGYKFDLRLYVLVTSFSPLEAFLYRRGFARLSSRPFTADPSQINNKFIHLTNSSIQKHSDTAESTMASLSGADPSQAGGTKCTLEYLWKRLAEKGINTGAVWESIIDLVVKSLVCVDDVIPSQPNSFEVFGYDVLIDANLKPWLIEVNASPSMGVDSTMDLITKAQMIADTVALVDPLPFDRQALVEASERRLKNATAFSKLGPAAATAASGLGAGVAVPTAPGAAPPAAAAPSAASLAGKDGSGGSSSGSGSSGSSAASKVSSKDRLNLDLDFSRILHEQRPRPYGAMPGYLGNYQRICPGSDAFNRAMKLKFMHFRSKGWATVSANAAAAAAVGGGAGGAAGGDAGGAAGAAATSASRLPPRH